MAQIQLFNIKLPLLPYHLVDHTTKDILNKAGYQTLMRGRRRLVISLQGISHL